MTESQVCGSLQQQYGIMQRLIPAFQLLERGRVNNEDKPEITIRLMRKCEQRALWIQVLSKQHKVMIHETKQESQRTLLLYFHMFKNAQKF